MIRSAKRNGFIAGADIGEFRHMTDAADVETRLTRGHAIIDRLDKLNVPTVAVIHGFCLGGGLELALACDYRIAIDDARFGFPEVMLGLHPGPRRHGAGAAPHQSDRSDDHDADRPHGAGRPGAVDRSGRRGDAGAPCARRGRRRRCAGKVKTRGGGLLIEAINSSLGRKLAASRMRSQTAKKAPIAHYPAPHALIELWELHGGDKAAMQKAEIASFARLMVTDTSRNLVRVFFLREKLKKLTGDKWTGKRVHVIGAGAMGGDIAAWCAWHGLSVTLADMKPEPLGAAVKRAAALYGKIGHKGIAIRDALDRLVPDLHGEGVRTADLVIEAVPESLELKRKVYAATEPQMRPDAILATNTSSIPLEELRIGLARPDRLVGLHFFNPVSRMQLVEVVSHDQASEEALRLARSFLGVIDRLPAPVKSAPGFLVNRALTPYLLEAMIMIDEGIKRETIDAAAIKFGMPMGPIELADQVGLDICLHVAEVLKASLPRPMPEVPQWLRAKVANGELGRKTGKGFYEWKDGEPVKERDAPPPTDVMSDRLILPMIDVCVGMPARGPGGGRRHGRRRDGLRHRLRAVPRRAAALCARPRRRPADAGTARPGLRRALPARSGLGPDLMSRGGDPPARFQDPDQIADAIISRVGKRIVLALPLGLGKANHVANALYARAAADPSIHLRIFTALTLERPRPRGDLERRFVGPLSERLFGGYPDLAYVAALHEKRLPPNIEVDEFFFQAGSRLNVAVSQRDYISANYTHALGYVLQRGVNVVAQLVAKRDSAGEERFSLSCNPDITLDLLERRRPRRLRLPVRRAGQFRTAVHAGRRRPAGGRIRHGAGQPADRLRAVRAAARIDRTRRVRARPARRAAWSPTAARLQIGIGSLGDAVAQALILRHRRNADFRTILSRLDPHRRTPAELRQEAPFDARSARPERDVRRELPRPHARRHPAARGRRHACCRRRSSSARARSTARCGRCRRPSAPSCG